MEIFVSYKTATLTLSLLAPENKEFRPKLGEYKSLLASSRFSFDDLHCFKPHQTQFWDILSFSLLQLLSFPQFQVIHNPFSDKSFF